MRSFLNTLITSSIKVWHLFLAITMTLFLGIIIQLTVSPIKTYKIWTADAAVYNVEDSTESLSHLISYKQALLKASTEDSIYLVVSLPDSTVTIYVKGVGIYSTKIIEQSQSSFLSLIKAPTYQKQFAVPQQAELLYATIEKEPIKVKIAPKNVEEAARMATIPDSVSFDPAFVGYQLANGTIIRFSAENEPWLSFSRDLKESLASLASLFGAVFHVEIRPYHPEIELSLDNVDLTAIYRAIPHQPLIIVYL